MHAISVKYLREKLPLIRSELKKGASFLIIHKSRPIAKLTPVQEEATYEEATDEQLEKAAIQDWAKDVPPLSKKELDYYLSLK